jgi:hypothetical protein
MHRVLTNNQLKIMQEIIEHLSSKKDRQITITEFLDACRYKSVADAIVSQINHIEKDKEDIIRDQKIAHINKVKQPAATKK